jgi:two-component sensor histidine kinase
MPAGSADDGRSAPVVAGGRSLTLSLDRVNTASRAARDFLRRELVDLDEDTLHTLLLVTTELVTNALLHAAGPIDLSVAVDERRVVIEVFDCEPLPPTMRDHDVTRTDGRGIALVAMVSDDWGSRRHDGGKTVWAAVPRTRT